MAVIVPTQQEIKDISETVNTPASLDIQVNVFGDDIEMPPTTIIKPLSPVAVIISSKSPTTIIPSLQPIAANEALILQTTFKIKNWKGRIWLEARRFKIYYRVSDSMYYWDAVNKGDDRSLSMWGPFNSHADAVRSMYKLFGYQESALAQEEGT